MSRFNDNLGAVMVLLKKESKVLLQKRQNTGYMDGFWDFSATGHVEFGESMKAAGVRETEEEIDVKISEDSLELITMMHKFTPDSKLTYYNGFFLCEEFVGTEKINEPAKCEELRWFELDSLPANLIPDRQLAIEALYNKQYYMEIGWTA